MQEEPSEVSTTDRRTPLLVSGLLLLAGLALTAFAVVKSQASIHDEAWYRYSQQFDRLDAFVRAQFNLPLRAMDGLSGMFAAGGRIERAQFDAWVNHQDLTENYPGVRGFGLLERVQRKELDRYVTQERLAQGPDFAVRSTGDAPDLYVVKYFAPQERNPLLRGLDAASDTAVRESIERIVQRGEPSLVRPSSPGGTGVWGKDFLYLAPLYKPGSKTQSAIEREAAFVGLVFAPIGMDDLLLPTLSISEGMIDFEVLDAHEEPRNALVFSSRASVASSKESTLPGNFSDRAFHAEKTQILSGHRVTIAGGSSPIFESAIDHSTPAVIGVTGSVLSALLAIVMLLSLLGRARAQSLAQGMTKDLDRLARVVRSTSHVVIVFDEQRDIVWVNEAFTRITGLELSQVMGHNFTRLFNLDESHPDILQLTRQAQDNLESLRLQVPWKSAAGAALWFDLDMQPEFDRNHILTGYVAVAADITGQRNASDQVARAMRENQALMDAIDQHSIVSIADHRGTITYANEKFTEITGYSNEELVGANHRIVKSDQQTDAFWESMWKTVSSGYAWHDTVCNKAKDGSLYWVDTTIAPFFDDAGNIEQYISIRTDVSSARRAQQDLATERAHLSAIITGTNAGTWEWEVPTGKVVINDQWAEIVGYKRQDLGEVEISVWERLCHPDDLKISKELLNQHFAGELPYYECELRMRHRNGEWIWIQARGKVTSWLAPGQPHWVSGIHLDISQQKALQSEVHQNNRVLQSILENIPVALSVFDGDLNLLARNPQFSEMLEFPDWLFANAKTTFESLIRFNASRGEYGSSDVEQAIQAIIERARHTTPHQFERVRPNGRALEVRGAPMPGGGFVTTYADISQRKAAEAEIERTASLLQSVLDSASEVSVISIGMDGLITLFNKGAERMFGVPAADVVGKSSPAVFFDADELQARASAMSALLNREVEGFAALTDESVLGKRAEWTYIHQDGHRFSAALVVTAMTDAQGKRTGYLGVSHDISLEKDNEQALRMAVQLAEQAALSKGQFLANMSHEIRTPMNAILGMLKLLQNTALDGRQKDYAAKTESAARSLLGLLNDILDFSKVEAGKMTLDLHAFSIDRVMRDLSVIMSANIGNRGIEVLFDMDYRLPPVLMGDSMRLQQVLINLGGNAIKFTEEGEVVVSVTLQSLDEGQARVRFAVKDSGIGIAPENQQHIFSGFSQAEASTTRRFGGTGLGLSICRRLIDMMGGELQLQSALGQGSTFFFEVLLPVGSALSPADGEQHEPLIPLPSLLIVDDNPLTREVLSGMVATLDWPVSAVGSGADALECMAQRRREGSPDFDTILMDWQMPVMDGWDTAVALRKLPSGDKPLIVMTTTAYGREVLTQRLDEEALRLDGFLVKPVTASMLHDAVRAAREERAEGGRKRRTTRAAKKRGLEGMRLLVVEDNAINQQVARELLSAEGAVIEIASNGQLGVDAVAKASPQYDAVLMDLQMPVMDGYTASVTIRHELGLYDLPIIAMTANAMASDREACLAAGMNDHIGKPFDLPELVALLNRHTGRNSAKAANPADDSLPAASGAQSTPIGADQAIDSESALARLGGNKTLYLQILDSFLREIATVPARLDGLVAAADPVECGRLMHTIKGLSITVGALALSVVCKDAEGHFKDLGTKGMEEGSGRTAEVLARLRSEIEVATKALQQIVVELAPTTTETPQSAEADPLKALDAATFVAEVQALQRMLRESDLGAMDVLSKLVQNHRSSLPTELANLESAVSAFDFSQAVVQCETLINTFTEHGTR